MLKEAMLYEKSEKNEVKCNLCARKCTIREGGIGFCLVRKNERGKLYSLVYAKACSACVDPITKKPLSHFHPGSLVMSIATVGCNFRCRFCDNWVISQEKDIRGQNFPPERVVETTKENECQGISYTYTEPTIFFEYAYDTARLAHEEGICNVFVSNGYITEEALRVIAPYLDAANIDLKGFSEEFYHKNCGAHLEPVLNALKLYKSLGIWLEVTTLVIPTLNDSKEDFRGIAEFIKGLGIDIPWHISQFYPMYKLTNLPRTPVTTLREAREIGLEVGLRYVYEGNVPGEGGEHTYCYTCGRMLIRRYGFQILGNSLSDTKCPHCGVVIDGIF